MEITIEQVKEFAWQQLDAMWHDNSGTATINMVRFDYKGYCIVNPWTVSYTHLTLPTNSLV